MGNRCISLILLLSLYVYMSDAAVRSCTSVQQQYFRHGFKDTVPQKPIPGDHLKMCNNIDDTCCTEVMENQMAVVSRQQFDKRLKDQIMPLANLLSKKKEKFDDSFLLLLNYSRESFDNMFRRTYGIMYINNAFVFKDLYSSLELYYEEGKLNLSEELDRFFKGLYRKMFEVFNSQYTFKEPYLNCVTKYMEELNPFGDVPQKLTSTIKRSFIALRTFVQGLATASDVSKNVLKVNLNINCVHELMKMTNCATCAGHQGVMPCLAYCMDVQHHCLVHHKALSKQWDHFVDSMVQLGYRLENPFNIENVVEPINIKVSDAIMNFQESGTEVSKKVFQGCGQPKLGNKFDPPKQGNKYKREAAKSQEGEITLETLDFGSSRHSGGDWGMAGDPSKPSIVDLVKEIRTKIKNSRNFWDKLPQEMCKDAQHHESAECWNGSTLGKYNGDLEKQNKGEDWHSPDMDELVHRLKLMTNMVDQAYNGHDVDWMDPEWLRSLNMEPHPSMMTSDNDDTDGSGSGDLPPVFSTGYNYPPDDEDGDVAVEGSADIPPDDYESSGEGIYRNVVVPVYDTPPRPDLGSKPSEGNQPPSGAPKDSMSLMQAITVYLLPAIVMFIGSIS